MTSDAPTHPRHARTSFDDGAPFEDGAATSVPRLSRRSIFGLLGAGAVIGATTVTAATTIVQGDRTNPTGVAAAAGTVPFHGVHQAGIVTPAQDRLHFAAFDLAPAATRDDLVALLKSWTAAAIEACRGTDIGPDGAVGGALQKPPTDTGEALGLPASQLTITVGFGTTLFHGEGGRDRFGLAAQRPPQLADL
ncbi:MAG: Dyp-type peroxidase domain-containing protein, partial [Pseudonocardiaceae bacterium]